MVKALKAVGAAHPLAPEHRPAPDLIASTRTIEKGHGRIETRQVCVSRECVAHLGWPGAAQVCRIERTRERAGRISREIAYAITSLTPEHADPDSLLALWRAHWLIENRLHWRRDVILREDHSTLRSGSSPQAVAALRNAVLHVVKDAPGPLAETRAIFAENRHHAIAVAQRGFL